MDTKKLIKIVLVPTIESKGKIKKYEEVWSNIRDLIKATTKNADDYDEKYMKMKLNSDHELPLNKTIENPSKIIVVFFLMKVEDINVNKILLDEKS